MHDVLHDRIQTTSILSRYATKANGFTFNGTRDRRASAALLSKPSRKERNLMKPLVIVTRLIDAAKRTADGIPHPYYEDNEKCRRAYFRYEVHEVGIRVVCTDTVAQATQTVGWTQISDATFDPLERAAQQTAAKLRAFYIDKESVKT